MAEGKAPLREKAFRDALAKTPGMEVVVTEDVKWNPAVGERAAGQLLARFAGQGGLNGFYGMNDVVANGAIQAAEAAGVKVGTGANDLIVVGGNCQAPGVKNIQAGKQAATLLMLPAEEGKLTAAPCEGLLRRQDARENHLPAERSDHQGEHREARWALLVLIAADAAPPARAWRRQLVRPGVNAAMIDLRLRADCRPGQRAVRPSSASRACTRPSAPSPR